MTTGSIDYNHLSSVATFLGGSVIGRRFQKSWNGQNRPAQPIRYQNVYMYDKVGNLVIRRRRDYPKPLHRSTVVENPYTCTYSRHNGHLFTQKNADGFTRTFSTYEFVNPASIVFSDADRWNSNDDIALLGKLREKVAGSDFNAGVAMGESMKTLTLITNSATRIFRALKHVRKGNMASAAAVLTDGTPRAGFFKKPTRAPTTDKQMSSLWLELKYGWMPLLKDVSDAAEFLAHMHSVPLQKIVRARKKKALPFSTAGSWTNREGEVRCSIKCILKEKNTVLLSGLLDPYSVAWELLPWSFVIDWFIPVGNYLSARGLAQAIEGTFVKTTFLRIRLSGSCTFNGYYHPQTTGGLSFEYGEVTRTVSTSLQVPLPAFKELRKVASWQHCVSAIALLSSLRPSVHGTNIFNVPTKYE